MARYASNRQANYFAAKRPKKVGYKSAGSASWKKRNLSTSAIKEAAQQGRKEVEKNKSALRRVLSDKVQRRGDIPSAFGQDLELRVTLIRYPSRITPSLIVTIKAGIDGISASVSGRYQDVKDCGLTEITDSDGAPILRPSTETSRMTSPEEARCVLYHTDTTKDLKRLKPLFQGVDQSIPD